ncbi:acyl-CoA thioesterase [candidate division KSB1 bacterium]
MEKIFKYHFQVNGYELDSFGHVNNAVYLNYLEQSRWEIVQKMGLLDFFKETNSFLVVVETYIKYINELSIFDKAFVETKMYRKGFFIEFRQNIFKASSKKISKAIVKCLFVDQQRNPIDIPTVIIPYLHE